MKPSLIFKILIEASRQSILSSTNIYFSTNYYSKIFVYNCFLKEKFLR